MKRLIAVPLVLALMTGVAWAYWSVDSVPGGNGASAATSVNQGATPTASATTGTVTVSWAATTLASGQAVSGYLVKRYDAVTPFALQTILTSCTGTISATSCVENSVPTGSWKYTVTPVMATNWQGAESLKSTAVTVDSTAPANGLALSSVVGGAYKNSNNIYYRGAALGSFTLTNTLVDANSGPASSATASLTGTSTGWTHTPSTVSTPAGGPYVSNTFAWSAATTTTPGEVVTGTDVAGNTTTTSLTTTRDDTNPSSGTISYTDGYTAGRSVSVSFVSGTDAGSGIDASLGRIKRSVAPLVNGVCGTYVTNADYALTPVSPYVDTAVANNNCYTYQYVSTDNVGNKGFASSASVAKISYTGAVSADAGLLSLWHFDETPISSSDAFTDSSGTALSSHTSATGTAWTRRTGDSTTAVISTTNTLRNNAAASVAYYSSAVPPTADYLVEADLVVKSLVGGDFAAVIGRLDDTGTGSGTFYTARYDVTNAQWQLYSNVNGTLTAIGTAYGQTLTAGTTYRVGLDLKGSTIQLLVDGAVRVTGTDTAITAAGRAGVRFISTTAATSTTGLHLDNFDVSPPAVDSKGTNTGDYHKGVQLGAVGAIGADTSTAATFDGANDYLKSATTTGLPVGAATRSVEVWFKTPGVASGQSRQALLSYGTNTDTQEFGVWLEQNGTQIKSDGGGASDRVLTWAANFNNNQWHHFVSTYDGTSTKMYVDGVLGSGTTTATRNTVVNSNYGYAVGAILDPARSSLFGTSYFNGSLDEMSFYSTALSAATVTNHYELGTAALTLSPTAATLAYTENGSPLLDSAITVTDPLSTTLTSATVTMTTAYVNGQDTLAFTNQNGITGTWTAGTGVLALSGTATLANYQTALRSITYTNNSDNPTTTTRTVTFTATDGTLTSSTASRTITLTAVNDAPVNSVPGTQSTSAQTPKVFSSGNGNLISISDADAGASSVQVQLAATNGATTLSGTTGLTFSVGDGTADTTMTFTGTTSNVNAALAGLSFTPTGSGAASLQIVTSDQGNTGTGGTLTDTDTISFGYGLFTTAADIGAGAAGPTSSAFTGSTYTEVGNGIDIGGTGDQFHYLYRSWTGDGTIIARVTALGNSSVSAKASVMFRESTAVGSVHAAMMIKPVVSTELGWLHRDTTDANSATAATTGPTPTYWLKVVRSGNTFTGYSAPDSSGSAGTWTQRGTQSITMASTILVGLATTSRSATATTTATYDNVSLTAPPMLTTTGSTLAYTENATPLLDSAITATDADSTNLTSATVTMTTAYVNGQDTLAFTNQNGITGTWTAATGVLALTGSATVAQYQTALQSITYNNTSDNPTTATRTVTFTANDGTFDSATASRTITVTAVNDPPVLTATGTTLAYTENATTPLDSAITATDADNTNLTSATVTMTTAYVNGQDTLAFTNQNGITGTWTAGTGVLALSGSATVAQYQTALRSINYNNNSETPNTTTRTVTFTASDGALTSNTASRTITVTAVNDAPLNSVPGPQSTSAQTPLVFSSGNGNVISISDADAGAASMQVQLVASNGTTTLSGAAGLTFSAGDGTADATMTFTGTITDVNAALAGLTFTPTAAGATSLQIVTSDQGNTGTGGTLTDSDTVSFGYGLFTTAADIGGPTPAGSSTYAGSTYTEVGNGADIYGTSDQYHYIYKSWTGDGTIIARVTGLTNSSNSAKAAVMFRETSAAGSAHAMMDVRPTAGNAAEWIYRSATGGTSASANAGGLTPTLWLKLVRTGNTFTGSTAPDSSGTPGTWTQRGTQSITMASTILVGLATNSHNAAATTTATYDNVSLSASSVLTPTGATLAYTENATPLLDSGITATDADSSNLTSATVTMTTAYQSGQDTLAFVDQNGITGTWTPGTGVLALSGTATVANYQAALRSITYNNTSDNPITTTRTVTFVANDGTADSNTASRTITVTAVNDAPVLTATGTTLAYTENATPLLDSAITATDVDSANLTSATVTMTTAYVNGQDTLAFTNQNGITGTWTAGTGVLALSGSATVANYQAALRSITYNNNSDTPTTTTRTVTFVASDGALSSTTTSRTITLTAVNDAPLNSVPGAQTLTMNTPLVFSSGNGNLISISDPDAASSAVQVQLTATNATLTLSGTTGLTFTTGDGTADTTMTFTGTIANVNLRLAGMSSTTTAAGPVTVQIITSDQGNSGTGGTLSDSDTVTATFLTYPFQVNGDSPWAFLRGEEAPSSAATSTATDASSNNRPGTYAGQTNGPSTHWDLTEGSGTVAADGSGAANPGTIGAGNTWLTDRTDKVLNFSGTTATTGYVQGAGPGVRTDASFTVSAWVNTTTGTGYKTAVSQPGTNTSGFYLQLDNTGKWAFNVPQADSTGSTGDIVQSSAAATTNTWTHLTGVYDDAANTVQLYVNGVSQGTVAHTDANEWNAPGQLQTGRAWWNGSFTDAWAGKLDDIRTYRRALSATEVSTVYGDAPSLAWDLEENTGTTTADRSGLANTGTLASGATWTSTGHSGKALNFNNTANAYVTSAAAPLDTTASFTTSAWVNLNTSGAVTRTVLSQQGTTYSTVTLKYESTGKWAFVLTTNSGGTADQVLSSSAATFNTWVHLVAVYDSAAAAGSKMRLYVNGTLSNSGAHATTYGTTNPLQLSRNQFGGAWVDPFDGEIDDVRTYRRALTTTEITNLYTPTAEAGMTAGVPGALQGAQQGQQSTTSVAFGGTANAYNNTSVASPGPTAFTIETWFKATGTAGGQLMGFTNDQTGIASTSRDRMVYLDSANKLTFGTWPTTLAKTVRSTATYNDGAWHHMAASLGAAGLKLYVDGALVASDATTTTAGSYTGYWRWGGGSTGSWLNRPTNDYFTGSLDEVAIFSSQLTDTQIAQHYYSNH